MLKRTKTFNKSNANDKIYDVVPVEKKYDKFGSWELDRFFGQIKLFLTIPTNNNEYQNFPPLWRTDEKAKFFLL